MSKLKLLILSLVCTIHAYTVSNESVSDQLTLKGKIDSHRVEYLHLPFAAKVKNLQPYGHIVKKGEAVFSVEYLSSKESLTHLILEYHQTLQAFSIATSHISTQKELVEVGAISHKSFQEEHLAYERKYTEVMSKRDAITKILEPYGLSIDDINEMEDTSLEGIQAFVKLNIPNVLHAPAAGILLPSTQDPHADIFKAHTHIAKVVDHHAFEVNLTVSEKHLTQLQEGQKVFVNIPSLSRKLLGTVYNVNRFPQADNNKSKYGVTIRFTDLDEDSLKDVYLGMSCIVNIELSNKEVLLVPITAVQTVLDKSMVILSNNGTFAGIREVTLGKTHGDKIEVTTGLKDGEEILEHYSNK